VSGNISGYTKLLHQSFPDVTQKWAYVCKMSCFVYTFANAHFYMTKCNKLFSSFHW